MSETSGMLSGTAAVAPPVEVTAGLLVIGNEILSGRTQDTNVAFLARELNEAGIRVREVRIIPDLAPVIVDAVRQASAAFDYVFTTGGIGPTHDDITAGCVAEAFGVALILHSEARARLAEQCARRNVPLNEARLRMAYVPDGAVLVDNAVSAAPGFRIRNVFVLAGVPKIAQSMFEAIRPSLVGGVVLTSRTVTSRLAEGQIAAPLGALQQTYSEIEIGSYPSWNEEGPLVSVVLRGTEGDRLDEATAAVAAMIRELGGEILAA